MTDNALESSSNPNECVEWGQLSLWEDYFGI